MTILRYIFVALEVVLLFNLLIGVHELGHFLAARWRGLKVERFAIWFGKPIWKKKINGVEYALGWIPAGGYVALPQMASMEIIEGKSGKPEGKIIEPWSDRVGGDKDEMQKLVETLPKVSPLDKIIVAFAGPLFSLLLAFVFAVIVWQVGKPSNEADNATTVGWVDPTGPAAKAGLLPGDTILEIDGHPVHHFAPTSSDSVTWRIVTSTGTNIAIKYLRAGREATVYAIPFHRETQWYQRKALRQILITSASKASIFAIASNSPAALAGLKTGDEILKLNGEKIYSPFAVDSAQEAMSNGVVKPLTLTVQRGGEKFDCTMLPVKPLQPTNTYPQLGITAWQGDTNTTLVHPSPAEQLKASAGQIFNTFGALFSKSEIGVQQLGGAVMIIRVYSNLFQDEDGWRRVLWFSVILNVNLALLNLLPLPVLDGGHITLSLIEWIFRRPVSARILEKIQSGFAALLITFMIYIAFFDTGDWLRSARADREVPVIFMAPANPAVMPDSKAINLAPINK
jgi:regulator of sigma E protease